MRPRSSATPRYTAAAVRRHLEHRPRGGRVGLDVPQVGAHGRDAGGHDAARRREERHSAGDARPAATPPARSPGEEPLQRNVHREREREEPAVGVGERERRRAAAGGEPRTRRRRFRSRSRGAPGSRGGRRRRCGSATRGDSRLRLHDLQSLGDAPPVTRSQKRMPSNAVRVTRLENDARAHGEPACANGARGFARARLLERDGRFDLDHPRDVRRRRLLLGLRDVPDVPTSCVTLS